MLKLDVWTKSERSGAQGDCVEAMLLRDGTVAVRDSKNPAGAMLNFTRSEWTAFTGGAKDGDFDIE